MVTFENRRRLAILSDGGDQIDIHGHRTRPSRMRYEARLQDDTRFESFRSKSRATIFTVQRKTFNVIRTGTNIIIIIRSG